MKNNHFFNTADENGQKEIDFSEKAKDQEKKIIHWLQKHQVREFTAYYIHNNVFGSNVPITSVRRAITKLKDQGYLEKTNERVVGAKGRKTIKWRLVSLAPTSEAKKTLRQTLNSIDDEKIQEFVKKAGCTLPDEFTKGAKAVIEYLKLNE